MKQRFLLPLAILLSLYAFGQKNYNTWYFGNRAGITFNSVPPSSLTDGAMYTLESSSSICDEKGNILFYTNGDTVWNKHHQFMKNNLVSNYYFHATSSQGSVIVKKPGSDHLYYIFCSRSEPSYSSDYCVRYWLIDMNGDNGGGEVVKMNEQLPLWYPLEGLAITKHSNEQDIWIGAINYQTGQYNFLRTVNGEVDGSIITTDLGIVCTSYFCSKFSPDAAVLLSHRNIVSDGSGGFKSVFYLHHFNNETGRLSQTLEIELRLDNSSLVNMSVEFSHNAQYLFLSASNGELIQYDLSVWDKRSIEKSATIIFDSPDQEIMGLQLGPDKKIYAFHLYGDGLTVIDKPWLKGERCNVLYDHLSLKGRKNEFGAPYYPTFAFKQVWDTETLENYVPNAFSPDGDDLNDVFTISGADLKELSIQIYNRWGEKMYDEHSLEAAWDGTLNGKPCPQDVYFYTISCTGWRQGLVMSNRITGNVTLLR